MKRRTFVQLLAAEAALPFASRAAQGAPGAYRVGVGGNPDPYTATQRAIAANGEFPAVSGRTVIIKPNLVVAWSSATGATTDPQVTRAVVDLALAGGAAQVLIIEGGAGSKPANFGASDANGNTYTSVFTGYNPKVQLVDLGSLGASLVTINQGYAYKRLYVTNAVTQPNITFISIGKLKTHVNAFASLSMKNLIALAVPAAYALPNLLPRMDLHFRGIDQAVVDVNLASPISYSVVDGIWGMEGNGPALGTPVQMNLVLAGKNPVAVDRAGVYAMQLPQGSVAHLAYAAQRGLGPADLSSVQFVGDTLTPAAFTPAGSPPLVWRPTPVPASFAPGSGQTTRIYYMTPAACAVQVTIVKDPDTEPAFSYVRLVQGYTNFAGGVGSVVWDGKDGNGNVLPAGTYLAQVSARATPSSTNASFATNWITITG